MAWLEIRTSPAYSVVQSTNHWATEHVEIVHHLYMFNMKTVSVRVHTFHTCENYVKVSHDCPTKRDGSIFKTLAMQQSSRNIKVAKISVMSSTVCQSGTAILAVSRSLPVRVYWLTIEKA